MKEKSVIVATIKSYYRFTKSEKQILDFVTHISKNIYNSSIYCASIYYKFKNLIISDAVANLENINSYRELMNYTLQSYENYYHIYQNILKVIKHNNDIIYDVISKYKTYLTNDNFYTVLKIITNMFKIVDYGLKQFESNDKYNDIVINDLIFAILKSRYNKNYNEVNKARSNHFYIPVDKTFFEQVKRGEHLFDTDEKSHYKKELDKIKEHFKQKIEDGDDEDELKISSYNQANIIKQFTYLHLGANTERISSDNKCNVINLALNAIKSFWKKREKGLKSNMPKYLDKYGNYTIELYRNKGFKIVDDQILLIMGNYCGENYLSIVDNDNIVKLDKFRYVDICFLKKRSDNINIPNNSYKIKIDNQQYYIEKHNENIIDGRHITIKLPERLSDKTIKLIRIQPKYDGSVYCVNFVYEYTNNIVVKPVKSMDNNEKVITYVNKINEIDKSLTSIDNKLIKKSKESAKIFIASQSNDIHHQNIEHHKNECRCEKKCVCEHVCKCTQECECEYKYNFESVHQCANECKCINECDDRFEYKIECRCKNECVCKYDCQCNICNDSNKKLHKTDRQSTKLMKQMTGLHTTKGMLQYNKKILENDIRCLLHKKDTDEERIEDDEEEKLISIDLGMRNLMVIYDPNGDQYIIRGTKVKSINHYFNKKINSYKSIAKQCNGVYTTKRIRSLLMTRENQIDIHFNEIVRWFIGTYVGKVNKIIIGYNKNWKQNISLGRETNKNFYQIPYCKLLDKLTYKMKLYGIEVIMNEESYTSKCNSLALEEICKHDVYSGERTKRGLFKSQYGIINADLNGAINIMRKYLIKQGKDLKSIKGYNIFNPRCVDIPLMHSCQLGMGL